jgi:hypothetical protein
MRNFKLKLLFFSTLILSVFFISQAALADPLLLRDNILGTQPAKMCVSPSKNIYVVWTESEGVSFNKSVDGGVTFTNTMILQEPVDDKKLRRGPEIGVNADGTIFIFYEVTNVDRSAILFMATSSDEGETFQTRIIHNEENSMFRTTPTPTQTRSASDHSSDLKTFANASSDLKIIGDAIYLSINFNAYMILARSLDKGISFELFTIARNDEKLEDSGIVNHSMGIDSKGDVYAVYTHQYSKEDDDGYSFLVYDIYFTRMKSGQNAFEPPRIIGGCHISRGVESLKIPRIVISSDDKIGIIWRESEIIPGENSDTVIKPYYYRISSDGGESFTDPVKLNFGDDEEGYERVGEIAVERDNNDVIHFLYWDRYNHISYAKSTDFFQSFSLAEQVIMTDWAPWFIDFFPVSESEIYLTWAEAEHSNDEKYEVDIFFSSLIGDPFDNHSDNTDPTSSQGGSGGDGGGGCFIDSII